MISFCPDFYPDELLYSLFARYYSRSGYMAYIFAAEDLFKNKIVKPNIEFINELSDAAIQTITKNISLRTVVEQHTMFPYHARFLNKDRRIDAFYALMKMEENYCNLLHLPKGKGCKKRYLRYCPQCAIADRNVYGETFWHRNHQLIGVNICPLHYCKLIRSSIVISSKDTPSLVTAEETVPESDVVIVSDNELECQLASYISAVFQTDVDLESDVPIGKFLHSTLEYTKYVSPRGKKRNMELLYKDFAMFYSSLSEHSLQEQWQLQKLFNSQRINTHEICMVALFLDVAVERLVKMQLPEKSQQEIFDEKIHILHDQGMKYPQIAKQVGASYDFVKQIGGSSLRK